MQSEGRTVVLDESMANLASAYLGMWQALDIYNPDRDRWSEPTDFGNEKKRLERADGALKRVTAHEAAPDLSEDIRRYRRALRELQAGGKFTESKQRLCRKLLAVGNQLGHDSASYARQQSQGA